MADALRPQHYVTSPEGLAACMAAVEASSRVALDTESNGFHAYVERVCLVQLSTDGADWALDPLAVDVRPLWPLCADPGREMVLHAAEYDVVCLRREYGAQLGRLFDTHAAAKALGLPRVGLGDLLADQLGVSLTEDEQKSDWGKRPLSAQQLSYAFNDVHHLVALRDLLEAQLVAKGLEAEARAEFERLRHKEGRPRPFDPEGWQKMKAARTLEGKGRGVLRALYLLRDQRARELDRPPFKVLSELFMAEVARRLPRTMEQLQSIPGVSSMQLRRLSAQLLTAVEEGLQSAPPARPEAGQRKGPPWKRGVTAQDPAVEERYQRLRAWRKSRAEARQVEVQVIAPNAVLLAVAKAAPDALGPLGLVDGMDSFRVEQYGAEILRALGTEPAPPAAPVAEEFARAASVEGPAAASTLERKAAGASSDKQLKLL